MIQPFEPLASLVAIATSRYGRLFVTGQGGGSALAATDARPRDQIADCHTLAPDVDMISVDQPWLPSFEPFQYRPLYTVVWREGYRRIWIARNCHSPFMLPPPTMAEPVVCACPDVVTGETDGRYGLLSNSYPLQAAQYTDRLFYRPYAPDLFSGAGPCAARLEPGFLTQWDSSWVYHDGDVYHWTADFRNQIDMTDEVDDLVRRALGLPVFPASGLHNAVAREEATMKLGWARYVLQVLDRRAQNVERLIARGEWEHVRTRDPLTWANIIAEGYFDAGAVGAWFADAWARRVKVLELVQRGLPVFYLWSPELEETIPALAMPAGARAKLGLGINAWEPTPTVRRLVYEDDEHLDPAEHDQGGPLEEEDVPNPDAGQEARPVNEPPAMEAPTQTLLASVPLLDRIGPVREDAEDPMDDSTDEATWSRIADTLDEIEGVGIGAYNPAPPTQEQGAEDEDEQEVAFPKEGYHFRIVHSTRLSTRMGDDITSVPCKRVDNQVQRLLQDDSNFMEELVPPRNRVLAGIDSADNAFLLGGPALLIYDDGIVRRVLNHAFTQGIVKNVFELLEFLIENGMRFSTGIGVTAPAPLRAMHLHEVDAGMWFSEDAPIAQQYRIWHMSVLIFVERRPHFTRAALARGGILSLIIRAFAELRFPLRPTETVFQYGSPSAITIDGRVLHDDWLSAAEEALLLGFPHAKARKSLLPPVVVFNKFYAGVLSNEIEDWFNKRLRELRHGKREETDGEAKGLMSTAEWKRALRSAARTSWYGA